MHLLNKIGRLERKRVYKMQKVRYGELDVANWISLEGHPVNHNS